MPRTATGLHRRIQSTPYSLYSNATNGNYVTVGTGNAVYNYERTQPFSLVFWIFPLDLNITVGHIFSEYESTPPYVGRLVRIDGGLLRFWLIANFGTTQLKANYTPPPRGQWTRVVITYDGSSLLAGTKCYYNGVLQTQAPGSEQTLSATIVSGTAFTRWGQWGGAGFGMPMYFLKFGLFNYELSTPQVLQDYLTGSVSGTGPIDYYETTEGSGTNLASTGSGANHGTINGTISWSSAIRPFIPRLNITQARTIIT